MRTITSGERALLASAHVNFHIKVEFKDGGGAWRELTNEGGVNYVDSMTWSASIDQAVMTGTITLKREDGTLSLSPLMSGSSLNVIGGSYAPLLDVGREIRAHTAVTAHGVAPVSGDWKSAFEGYITDIDFGGDPITISVGDKGVRLQEMQIETLRTYGAAAGLTMESAMQSILDDNAGAGTYPLVTPTSPGAFITPYDQSLGSVLDALRTLALQIGWDVRYWYDASDVFQLTFFSIDRTKTTPDATISPSEYIALNRLTLSDADVRNVVRVKWQDKTSLAVQQVVATDAGSIAEFGRRFMEIGYGSTNNIDTLEEGTAMAVAAVSDLAQPLADQESEQFFFWPVQLGDLLTFQANGVHYDEDQSFGVIAYTHTLSATTHRTTIQVRGKVAGAYRRWLLTRNGLFPGAITVGPAPIFFPPQAELQAYNDPAEDGMIWQQVQFEPNTKTILLWAVESQTEPTPIPELAENRVSWRIQRQDGDQWSGDNVSFIVPINTRAHFFRKVIGLGEAADGTRGALNVAEIQAEDTGTGPTAAPSGLAFDHVGQSWHGTWTVNDPDANHILFRNGLGIVLEPGVSSFLDSGIQVDIPHTYELCAFRSGQTSERLSFGTIAPTGGSAGAPTWQAGYPLGVGANSVDFRWTTDASTTEVAIEIATVIVGGFYFTLASWTDPFHIPTGSLLDSSQPRGTQRLVRLRALIAGVYKYSTPIKVTWGDPVNNRPTFVNGTPWRTVAQTSFEWRSNAQFPLANPAVTMQVWAQLVSGGPFVLLYTETSLSAVAHGTFIYTATDLAGMNAKLVATYGIGAAISSQVVQINGAL